MVFWCFSLFCKLFRDLTTSPGSSYKPYLKFSVNAILARGEDGEEDEEDKKVVLKSSREEKDHGGSPSPSLSPQPAPYPSSSPPLSPIVTQVKKNHNDPAKSKIKQYFAKVFCLTEKRNQNNLFLPGILSWLSSPRPPSHQTFAQVVDPYIEHCPL